MRFTRNPEREDELIAQFKASMVDEERKEMFPSMTDLIYCLTKAYFKQRYFPELEDRRTILQFYQGIFTEQAIFGEAQNATKGEFEGVFYHTDHVAGPVLEETKTTASALNKAPDNIPFYQQRQVMGYMKAEGLTKARFIIWYKSGNYKPPTQPDLAVWDVIVDQDEIDANWEYMLERKQILMTHVEAKTTPRPYTYRTLGDMECNGCQFESLCQLEVQGLA